MRKVRIVGVALFVAALAATTLAVAGCGDTVDGMTAEEIAQKSQEAMAGVQSAAFGLDVQWQGVSEGPVAEDVAELGGSVRFTVDGAYAVEPRALDMKMRADVPDEPVAVAMKVDGDKGWIEYDGVWYELPPQYLQSMGMGTGASPTAAPTVALSQQLAALGIDIDEWVKAESMATEQLDGVEVYHVTEEVDVAAVAADLGTMIGAASLLGALGGDPQGAEGLQQLQDQSGDLAKQVEEAVEQASLELWYETGSFYLRKATVQVELSFPDGMASQGVKGGALSVTFTMGAFGEPVEVQPPADAKPFEYALPGMWQTDGSQPST